MTYEVDRSGQAEMEKFSKSTFSERKIMSTKTSIKRIAAVAAVALTLGGFSAVSAHAGGSYAISTAITSPYLNVFQPSGINHGAANATSASTATAVTENATGYAITQSSSAAGYTTLVPVIDQTSVTSVSANFVGASSVTASPASAQFILSDTVSNTPSTVVTIAGSAASVSGTNVSFAADSAGNTELLSSALTAGLTADTVAAFSAATSPIVIAAEALYPAYNHIAYIGTSATNASIKVSAVTAGSVTATVYKNSILAGFSTSTPVELFNITILAGSGSATLSYVSVAAALGTSTAVPTNSTSTNWVDKASDTGNLTITASAFLSSGFANGSALNAPALTYSVSGVGLLNATAGAGVTYVAVPAQTWIASNAVTLTSDGRSGTSVVTVAAAGTTVGTITVVFYGKVASVSVSQNYSIGKAGGGTTGSLTGSISGAPAAAIISPGHYAQADVADNAAVLVTLKDANGTVVPADSGLSASSSAGTVILSGITADYVDNGLGSYTSGFGVIHTVFSTAVSAASGNSATITYSYTNSDGTVVSATPVKFTVGGKVAKTVLSTDATTYLPGQVILVTETATDASGNPVYDGAASATLTTSKAFGGAAGFNGYYVGGVDTSAASLAKSKWYAPALPGDFIISGTDSALNALSLTATVGGDTATDAANAATDAANEATDAANAATDAANAAADSADAATQAAMDAGDKADAALAAVTALSQQVTTVLAKVAALASSLAKISAAIAKLPKK
jgi:hypothetical protein